MKYALIFPGQGSQSIAMLADLAQNYPVVQDVFARASSVLGFDLWQLTQTDAQALNKTQNTQVAMLAAGYAVYKVLASKIDLQPKYLAGHSLGEWTALVAGNYLSFESAVLLVARRAKLMQEASPDGVGAMAAVLGLDDEKIMAICAQIDDGVIEAVNFNSPGQVVIAGHKEAVATACYMAKNAGAKRAILLPVSVPSHCALMKHAATKFAADIKNSEIQLGNCPIVHNVNANIASSVADIKNNLLKQLYNSVKWSKSITYMKNNGVDTIIECGPGKVLSGLTKRIDKSLLAITVNDNNSMDNALEELECKIK